jgi:putative 4-mercaptohistidine N1-methyltranferase
MTPFYESERALAEYLLFHYGSPEAVLPYPEGPSDALDYPVRCVTECLDIRALPANPRALDLGCAVGRSAFELARHCTEVVGIDASHRFIEVAGILQQTGEFAFEYAEEGNLNRSATARVPEEIRRDRVRFQTGNAEEPAPELGTFDVILLANLIDRLQRPQRCLGRLAGLARPGGQIIVTSPYTWMESHTPVEHWIGGFQAGGQPIWTLDGLKQLLEPHFDLAECKDLPFLIREHARKFQWSVAEASLWRRRC